MSCMFLFDHIRWKLNSQNIMGNLPPNVWIPKLAHAGKDERLGQTLNDPRHMNNKTLHGLHVITSVITLGFKQPFF